MKAIKYSISKSGLKTESINADCKTIGIPIPRGIKNVKNFREEYENIMKKNGMIVKHQKDINYVKPFWKFWGMNDYSIAVFEIQCSEMDWSRFY